MTYDKEKRSLVVSISELTEEDTAVYWCGVHSPMNMITRVEALVLHVSPLIGYEGGELRVRCPYDKGYEKNRKYLNRVGSPHHSESKTLIQTSWSQTQAAEGRFSLSDDVTATVFTVTITGLTAEDSGKYECGVKRYGHDDIRNELQVLVKQLENIIGYENKNASITCKYQRKDTGRDEYMKYFCKGQSPSDCINTGDKVQSGMTLEDRFSLRDDPTSGIYTVTITDLRKEDAGIYWCVELCNKAGYINTTAVKVEVEPDGWETTTTLPSVSTISVDNKFHFSGPLVMLTLCLTIAALVLGIAVLICIKYRRMRTQEPATFVCPMNRRDNAQSIPDYENDTARDDVAPPNIVSSPVYQSLNPKTMQPDSAYQSLNPNTMQQDPAYQSLNPNTMQHDSAYQSLNPYTMQQDPAYQSLNPNTMQQDPAYQSLNPNTMQQDSGYQSLNTNTQL
ncbi:CMRF35-like molecule 1 [Sardina pilchardus]|uniref:CMRF35-like molecule 1 n=1 Tax=Sardina pilchardus TaxID=27697 RepID=UPI002E1206BB